MPVRARTRASASIVAVLCAALFIASGAQAGKAPSLASTAQYKAFVEYVKKLDGMVGKPTSSAEKDTFETELTTKKEAAAHKANALFNRKSEEAQAEADAKFKEQSEAIRAKEEEELAGVGADFGGKVERAIAGYEEKVAQVETGRHNFEAKTNEQIADLRAKKAAAADVAQKEPIQQQITVKIEKIAAKRQEAKDKRADLKAGLGAQKEELHAAQAKQETEIGEAAEAKVEKSSKHWKKDANDKKASFDAKRDAQLAYLDAKLEKGRADVASMPAA